MKKSRQTRALSIFMTVMFMLSVIPAVGYANEMQSDTIFDFTFDMPGASTDVINSENVSDGRSITNTWYDTSVYNTGKLMPTIKNSTVSYRIAENVFTKSGYALELSGYDSANANGSASSTINSSGDIKSINKSYTTDESIDCTANGSFRISFDFASTNTKVPTGLLAMRTLANTNGTLGESTQFGKEIVLLDASGNITVFGDKIEAAQVGAINNNEWHHLEITINSDNQSGVKLDGRVIRNMTAMSKSASGVSIRGLQTGFHIPVSYAASSDANRDYAKHYFDNIKYEVFKTSKITNLADDDIKIDVTENETVLLKSCHTLYIDRTKTAADLKNSVSGSYNGASMTEVIIDSNGNVLSDAASLTGAAALRLINADGIVEKSFELLTSYETVYAPSAGYPEAFVATDNAGDWGKSGGATVTYENGIAGKAFDDKFMKLLAATGNSNEAALNFYVANSQTAISNPFTLEFSLFIPELTQQDTTNSLYLQLIGSGNENLMKISPSTRNSAAIANHDSQTDQIGIVQGRWHRIAVEFDHTKSQYILYVNGNPREAQTLNTNKGVTRIKFYITGNRSDTCFYGFDDIRVHEGVYNYSSKQSAVSLRSGDGKFIVSDNANGFGSISVNAPSLTVGDVTAIAAPLTAALYTDDKYTTQASGLANGNRLVVTDGNGLYAYYDLTVSNVIYAPSAGYPEAFVTSENAGDWGKNSSATVTYENGIGGKAAADKFMKLLAPTTSDASLNFYIADKGMKITNPFTLEFSLFVPNLSEGDARNSLYLQLIGDGNENLMKISPSNGAVSTLFNHDKSDKQVALYQGRWNRIAVSFDHSKSQYILYVNGVAQEAETLTTNKGVTRIKFNVTGGQSNVCYYGIDDIKVNEGFYDYPSEQNTITLADESGKFAVQNVIEAYGSLTVNTPGVKMSDLNALVPASLTAALYKNAGYSEPASELADGSRLVLTDGNGMYAYYDIVVPEIVTSVSYSNETETEKDLTLVAEYNGNKEYGNVTLFVAQYKDGVLVRVDSAATASIGKTNTFNLTVINDASSQKGFIWETQTLRPIAEAIDIPIE